jgi:outer membrane protein assembly factor BamE
MKKNITFIVVFLSCNLLSGCSGLHFPGVYTIPIEQGNIITQEMVDQLKPGMSKDQVEYIMGSALIKDTFNAQRWDYVYNIKRGTNPRRQYRMTMFFKNDKLENFTGDIVPTTLKEATAKEKNTTDEPSKQES